VEVNRVSVVVSKGDRDVASLSACRSSGEERKKMETTSAIKWTPPVGDRVKN
jgi:hypothetical protein